MFLLFIVILASLVYLYINKKKNEQFWNNIMAIPGPKAYPFIGTEYHIKTAEKVFERERQLSQMYYPIFKKYCLGLVIVCLVHPEDLEVVLNNSKHIEKSIFYELLQDWLGSGLLTSKGQNWHKRRKILTPAFHFTILQQFVDVFNKEIDILVEELKKICHRPYIDVIKPIAEFTLCAIGETSLGKDFREDSTCETYKQAVYDYGDNFVYRAVRPWLHIPLIYKLSHIGKKNKITVDILHEFSSNIVKEKNKAVENNNQLSYSTSKRLALLDLMIRARQNGADIDDVGIREELDTFILAGHDTTAIALCHILMILANEPKIQNEIYQEIISVVGQSSAPSFADLGELKYTERCIKESLRLYPSVPAISRVVQEDIKTKSGNIIPKDCVIFLQIYDMHRSPEVYTNPEKFDPDRFLPENSAKRHPFAYLPFSAGSRNCIGQKYAMLELKAALCGILRHFKLEPVTKPSDLRHKADIVLRPAGEIKVKFVAREEMK